ncbi:unnamed protein product, partial [Rotaria sp. Silwood1]
KFFSQTKNFCSTFFIWNNETNFNYQQRPLVTADDLPSLVAQTPTSILISSANNNNKCKLTSHDNTFTALYSAAHSKSSRQSKMNVCTPIEHYE